MPQLVLLASKPVRNSEILELYRATYKAQTVYRLVWTDHNRAGKPAMLDCVDFTKEIDARNRFDRTR